MARRRTQKSSISPWLIVAIVGGVGSVLAISCCGIGWWALSTLAKPTVYPDETEPYEQARAKFQTKLITKGPAPFDQGPLTRPPGVNELPYKSGELALKALVSVSPPDGQKRPAVVFLHGGFAFGDEDWETVDPFLKAGFAVMIPILRGENGQPGSYSMFYDEVSDVLAATDAFAKLPYVDSTKLYLCGHSVGGSITMLTALSTDRFKAAASFSGSTDQTIWSRGQKELCPFDLTNPEEYRMRSPLAFPKSVKCPLRIYYGDEEFLFKGMSQAMATKAKQAGKDVEAEAVDGDHGSMLDEAIPKAIAFFRSKS